MALGREAQMKEKTQVREILNRLKSLSSPDSLKGMGRFGIHTEKAFGVSIPNLRKIAKALRGNHTLALQLWESGVHEARILAGMMDDPQMVNEPQMEEWVQGFDSWDLCDQCCSNLFDKTKLAYPKAIEWSKRKEEFVKRAGFVLMACLAVHDKEKNDKAFEKFLSIIQKESKDDRNFVKKAVNWALRQIGKRNPSLHRKAIETARAIHHSKTKTARWIAADALRELESAGVRMRLAMGNHPKKRNKKEDPG